ncbi:MAG: transaldolase family protein [Archaeoglobaceae archaeon]
MTTNPTLIKKAVEELKEGKEKRDIDMADHIKKILKTARGKSVNLEVTESSYTGMVEQGRLLYQMFNPTAGNVCIRIPVNPSYEGEVGKE